MTLSNDEQKAYNFIIQDRMNELINEIGENKYYQLCDALVEKGMMKKSKLRVLNGPLQYKYRAIIKED